MPPRRSSRDKNKKLTDFFTQRPAPPLATSSSPATTRRPATRASTAALERESSMKPNAPPQTRSASMMTTRKRARSPDNNNPSISSRPPPKPRPKPNPHAKRPTAVVYLTSPFRNCSARRSTPVQNDMTDSPPDSSKQAVCSSQSDEAELVLPTPESHDLRKVVQGIHSWRRKTFEFSHSSSPRAHDDAMEVDTPPSSPTRDSPVAPARSPSLPSDPPICSATPRSSTAFQTPIVTSTCLPSPPNTNQLPPLPATPEPMDSDAKTAKVIAEIKARAYAANQSSDDEKPLEFRELEDSDDDDLIGDLPLISNAKGRSSLLAARRATTDVFSSPLSSVPSTFDATIDHRTRRTPDHSSSPVRPTRTSARNRKPTATFRLPVTVAGSSSVREKKSGSVPLNRKKPRATNPLHALLREKELEDKRGTSCAAVRRAEEAVIESSRETPTDSHGELDNMSRSRLTDEQSAWKAVRESHKSTSPDSFSDVENFIVGDRESKILGAVAGEAINKILAGDKVNKGKERVRNADQEIPSGILLWIQSSDEDMEVDPMSIPPLSGHAIFTCLDGFLKSGDESSLDLALRSGALAAVPKDTLMSNMPQLLEMALLASSQIADAVCIALRDLWVLNPNKIEMPFAAILFVLVRLGANPLILEGIGLIPEGAQKNHVTHTTLLEAVKRLFSIVRVTAFAGAFSSHDIANVVLILLIMGLDPSTSSKLRTLLNLTIDVVCNHGATDFLVHDIHEKVLRFTRQLVPTNKAQLVSFFASGSGRTRSIAQHLAYSLLVSTPNITQDQAPPLEPLILLLSPDAGSCELFDVTSESTDYEELGHYVNILSVALIDIAPYVEEERALMRSASTTSVQGSPNRFKKPPAPPLELLRKVLEALQSKIVDTRAAHLDRSRTKATLQRLTLRICYDRMALTGARPRRRACTLEAYFSPQRL